MNRALTFTTVGFYTIRMKQFKLVILDLNIYFLLRNFRVKNFGREYIYFHFLPKTRNLRLQTADHSCLMH